MSETPPTPFDDQHDSSGHPEGHPNLPGLDELIDSGWEPHTEEAQQLLNALQPLEALRETPPAEDVLVQATLARIKATPTPLAASSAAISSSITTGGGFGSVFQFRLPDLFGMAASLLLATSILLALGRGSKLHSRDELCGANIRALGTAVESFASDHRREVPS
ncbi:MAG: hypothetical protein VX109_04355 [Planctomycetota bacterium]|nr:hypothetical protein [Planctomycetota bacterium]